MGLLLAICLSLQDAEALVQRLASQSFEDQGVAAKALDDMGAAARPALHKALRDKNETVRDWARRILVRIDAREEAKAAEEKKRQDEARRARDGETQKLIEQLGGDDYAKQGQAAESLKKLGKEAVPLLKRAHLESSSKSVREWAGRLLEALGEGVAALGGADDVRGAFGQRFGEGLSRERQEMVNAALAWLARHQSGDGGWSPDGFKRRCGLAKGKAGECTDAGHEDFEPGVTGLATLAFLGAGRTHHSKEATDGLVHGEVVQRALRWMVLRQDPEGAIGARTSRYMYGHAMCTLALAEAFGMTGAAELKGPAQKAVDFLVNAQNPGLAWRYSSRSGDNDTSVTSWCVSALKAAELAGLSVPKGVWPGVQAWLDEVTDARFARAGYTQRGTGKVFVQGANEQYQHHETLSAAGGLMRVMMGAKAEDLFLQRACDLVAADKPSKVKVAVDFYYWHYGAAALHQAGRSRAWEDSLVPALKDLQSAAGDACKSGSWDATDRWGFEGGRVYATALNAMTLLTERRHPVYGRK